MNAAQSHDVEQCAKCGEPMTGATVDIDIDDPQAFPFATAEWGTVHPVCSAVEGVTYAIDFTVALTWAHDDRPRRRGVRLRATYLGDNRWEKSNGEIVTMSPRRIDHLHEWRPGDFEGMRP